MSPRLRRPVVAVTALLLGLGVVTSPVTTAPASAVYGDPGFDPGSSSILATNVDLQQYDILVNRWLTGFVGWISSPTGAADRQVHLCVRSLVGAETCRGGVQSAAPGTGGNSSAKGLRVLPVGDRNAELVWFYDTPGSVGNPDGGRIASAQVVDNPATPQEDHVLGSAVVERVAPSFGQMLTAEAGPGGLWTVNQRASGSGLEIARGDGVAADFVQTPWRVGTARLAFAGQTPVVVYDKYGDIDEPLRVTRYANGAWQPATRVARTWSVGGAFDVEAAGGRVHLVSTINNASYRPQIAVWGGRAFGAHRPTGNTSSCHASTHDLVADRSGRLADISRQCTQLAIANHPRRAASAIVRGPVGGTPNADLAPQIGVRAHGEGWAVYSRSRATGDTLLVRGIHLPTLLTTVVGGRTAGGRATVRGPVSCMPGTRTPVAVGARPVRGWRVVSHRLTLDGRPQGPVLTYNLPSSRTYRLVGVVTFAKGDRRVTARATLPFRTCLLN